MKRKQRYLKKIEMLEKEVEFLKTSELRDETAKRAVFYSLQVSVEILMDICAMRVKDIGLTVEDDYTNIEKLQREDIITEDDAEILKGYNGMRNIIVHRYKKNFALQNFCAQLEPKGSNLGNKIKLDTIKEGVDGIDSLINIGLKISG